MKNIILTSLVFGAVILLAGCGQQHHKDSEFVLELGEYAPITDAEVITVKGDAITIDNRVAVGSVLNDIALDQPVGEFDKIEQVSLSSLEGYTLIYSVPSLDTPVCTLQTKQIEAASEKYPEFNFVIVSHDTPFALERFCTDKNIENVLTLSDSRSKEFARQNGLYMSEYNLMTRAIVIVNDQLEVVYSDYADEVTDPVDLLNAFAYLETL